MPAPDSTAIQVNFKVGNGLHNIYATSIPEAGELIDAWVETILPKIVAAEQTINAAVSVGSVIPLAPAAQQPAPQAPPAPPPAAPAPPPQYQQPQAAPAAHLCEHGQPMKLVPAGVSKSTGNPYPAFYACAMPRGQQCRAKVSA